MVELNQPYIRLNGSHIKSDAQLQGFMRVIGSSSIPTSNIVLDLQFSKARIGALTPDTMTLAEGQEVQLFLGSASPMPASAGPVPSIPVPHLEIFANVDIGDCLVLQDASIRLRVVSLDIDHTSLRARVESLATSLKALPQQQPQQQQQQQPSKPRTFQLRSSAGVHIASKPHVLRNELSPQQISQIRAGMHYNIGSLALSFVQTPQDITALRQFCNKTLNYSPRIVAKLERPEAIDQLDEIGEVADELWLCRGDLGSFVSGKDLAEAQEKILEYARRSSKPVIIAGQVFHHLVSAQQPTRSEVVHLFNIMKEGAAGIVLSDETVLSTNPVGVFTAVAELLQTQ